MKRDIHLEWLLPSTPEEVWTCLTDPELVSEWLMKTNFKPEAGYAFNFFTKPVRRFGWDGVVHCIVLEIIPQKKLSYSWKGGPGDGTYILDTIVTWTLEPKDDGTLLTLEHTGFSGFRGLLTSFMMKKGWKDHVLKRFRNILTRGVYGQV